MGTTLKVTGIKKKFPGINALDWDSGAEIVFHGGLTYGLLGENGAGKSTLSKIIAGIYQRDGGEILLDDEPFNPASSEEARRAGIGIIMQEEGLVNSLKVSENLLVCKEKEFSFGKIYSLKKQASIARDIMKDICPEINPNTIVRNLSLEDQKLVEIARAVRTWPKVLLIDETSAALSKDNVAKLFDLARQAKEHGSAVIMITHRMEEIFEQCDKAVILKDGKLVGEYNVADTDLNMLSKLMVGREVSNGRMREAVHFSDSPCVMRVRNASLQGCFSNLSFDLQKGEIIGIAGLNGGGKDEILPCLFGEIPLTSGKIEVNGKLYDEINPQSSIEKGIAYIPKFRDRDGLVLRQPIGFNILLPLFRKLSKKGFLQPRKNNKLAESYSTELMVKCGSINDTVDSLSGGNRQKVIVARWMANNSTLMLMDNPTRGIDVGARAEIYRLLNKLTAEGCSVVMVSDDLPEVLSMSDRIIVVRRGEVSKYFDTVENITEQDVVLHMI